MQGNKHTILLPFTKKMLLASTQGLQEMNIGDGPSTITVFYKLRSERSAGIDQVEFPCKCKGKHGSDFVPVD